MVGGPLIRDAHDEWIDERIKKWLDVPISDDERLERARQLAHACRQRVEKHDVENLDDFREAMEAVETSRRFLVTTRRAEETKYLLVKRGARPAPNATRPSGLAAPLGSRHTSSTSRIEPPSASSGRSRRSRPIVCD